MCFMRLQASSSESAQSHHTSDHARLRLDTEGAEQKGRQDKLAEYTESLACQSDSDSQCFAHTQEHHRDPDQQIYE